MAALTATRDTRRAGEHAIAENHSFLVKANVKIQQGALVVVETATGFAKPGVLATGLIAVGIAEALADNTGGADGAIRVSVRTGAWKLDASATNLIVQATVTGLVYIEDDHTVGSLATGMSAAGKLLSIEPDGQVLVQVALV